MVALLLVTALPQVWGGTKPEWYSGSSVVAADGQVVMDSLRQDRIDLLYLVSTGVLDAKTPDGKRSFQSLLVPEDRKYIDMELAYVQQEIGRGDFNYLAPYYHQFTFASINLPKAQRDSVFRNVSREVCDIFDYYITHVNQGRKFALVGFSQGAMLMVEILKHATKKQLRNMVGAYCMGYGLSKEDLKHRNIVAAKGAEGLGHTVSFNSVMSREATWDVVYNNSATVINPVNWTTTTEPATFDFEGSQVTVTVDKESNQLLVSVPDKTPYHEFMRTNPAFKMAGVHEDNLHHWDLLYYTKMLHDNILWRAGVAKKKTATSESDLGVGMLEPSKKTSAPLSKVSGDDLRATGCMTLLEALWGMIAGVEVYDGDEGIQHVSIRGSRSQNGRAVPLYIVDGREEQHLMNVSLDQVKDVEVLKDGALYGVKGGNGAVIVHLIR